MSEAAPVSPGSNPANSAAPAPSDTLAKSEDSAPSIEQKAPDPKPTAAEKFLIKVNGKLRELSREDAIRELQKGQAARENFEKAAALTKKNQAILKALADPDPDRQEEALRQLGVDPDKLAERRFARRAQEAQLTPEQKRIAELEAEMKRREDAAKSEVEQRESELKAIRDREVWAKMEQEYLATVDGALKSGDLGGLKPAEALYLMAEAGEMNLEYGLSLTPQELLAEAKAKVSEQREELRGKVMALEGDALLNFLGPDATNRVLRAARDKYKRGEPFQQPLEKPAPIADQAEPPKRVWKRPSELKTPFL